MRTQLLTAAAALVLSGTALAAPAPRLSQASGTVQSIQVGEAGGTLSLQTPTGVRTLKIPPGMSQVVAADGSHLHLDAIRRGDAVRADIASAGQGAQKLDVVQGLQDLSVQPNGARKSSAAPSYFPYGH